MKSELTSLEILLNRITELENYCIYSKAGSESDAFREMTRLSRTYNEDSKPLRIAIRKKY